MIVLEGVSPSLIRLVIFSHHSFAAFGWPYTVPSQELARTTYDKLFGAKAVEGHSFLLAKARDINAAAAAGVALYKQWLRSNGARGNRGRLVDQASLTRSDRLHFSFLVLLPFLPCGGGGGVSWWPSTPPLTTAADDLKKAAEDANKTPTERRLESLLDTIPKSPPSLLSASPPASADFQAANSLAPSSLPSSADTAAGASRGPGAGVSRGADVKGGEAAAAAAADSGNRNGFSEAGEEGEARGTTRLGECVARDRYLGSRRDLLWDWRGSIC